MRSLRRSVKALSPVVAAIILIAVTVAVSIAVAAWMGALTFTFMNTEELEIQYCTFVGSSNVTTNDISLTVKNKGTSKVTISSANIEGKGTFTVSGTLELEAGKSGVVTINDVQWVSGTKYQMELITASGKKFPYQATAT